MLTVNQELVKMVEEKEFKCEDCKNGILEFERADDYGTKICFRLECDSCDCVINIKAERTSEGVDYVQ